MQRNQLPDASFDEQLEQFLKTINQMVANPKPCNHSIYEKQPKFESNGAADDDFYHDVKHSINQYLI